MREMIERIARSIVSEEDLLEVSVSEGDYQTCITLTASEDDVGKLVGRGGRTIGAIRDLLDMAAEKSGNLSLYNIWVGSQPSLAIASK